MDIREIEDLIKNLKSVINCRIVLGEDEKIKEVHVVANESRSAKQISRDVQSILAAIYESETDYKKISVAQVKETNRDLSGRQLKIKCIERTTVQSKFKVKVVLEKDGEEYTGECSGMNNSTLCLRKTGEATVLAIEQFLREDGILSLDDIKIIEIANIKTVVVAVTVYSNEKSTEYSGSSILSHDSFDCVVRAILDAIDPLVKRFSED